MFKKPQDISASLPLVIRNKLLEGEEAYYYLEGKSGCLYAFLTMGFRGKKRRSYFLLTDSRVMMQGEERVGRKVKRISATDIPLEHVSSVSLEHEKGCLWRQDSVAVRSGTAAQYVPVVDTETAQEAINMLQLLLRERRTQR